VWCGEIYSHGARPASNSPGWWIVSLATSALSTTIKKSHSHRLVQLLIHHTHPLHPRFLLNTTISCKMEAVRSVLQPVTQNLPAPIHDLGVSILGEACYKTLLIDIDPTATECIKLAISKGLGIGIIATSSIVKVPQILKLINSKSSSGISFLSYVLETSSYLISLAYNFRQGFPFSTYGETALILVQNVVITVLVLQYSGKATMAGLFVAALAAGAATLFSKDILDMKALSYLQAGAGLLSVSSKLPQILTVFQEGTTGQLSAFAVSYKVLPV
jgi:mannose-P-dolichol utilization defect protein 1